MIWHITKRELYDNLNSLRFALTTLLLLALMLINALVHHREHPDLLQKYRENVGESLKVLSTRTDSLYLLASEGPGELHKAPSQLSFCADGGEAFLPTHVDGWNEMWVWRMTYPAATPNLRDIRPDFTKVDWAFIIGYVLSFIALLFTFDAIAGERESGTLRLMLANPIPRHTVLIGKFLGALISLSIPFALAVLMNLLLIYISGNVQLGAEAWMRLGMILSVAMLYICIFIALGLLISARVRESAVSLVILLLIWVVFVVFTPSTLASIASGFSPPMSTDEFWNNQHQAAKALEVAYESRLQGVTEPSRRMRLQAEYYVKDAADEEKLNEEHLNRQIAQVAFARTISRISPAAVFQHLLESFSGTGFERHLQFLENAQRYARQFRQFVVDMDRADPRSLHIIGSREGMSQRKISAAAIPKFEDTLSLNQDFNTAATDVMLLVLLLIVLLSGVYLAFVRVEV